MSLKHNSWYHNKPPQKETSKEKRWQKKNHHPRVDLSRRRQLEDEEDVVMTTSSESKLPALDTFTLFKGNNVKAVEQCGDVLEAAKAGYSACNKGKKFAYEHEWRVLKKHPKWDAADHFDSEDHTEIFGPDASPRPPGLRRPPRRQNQKQTASSAG
ncbi:hypothetical protein Tco_0626072 [Tanacetum coccineum]|uniref:No apical meristem-associated C-terminal domain-containing protein n=1 Tax=Tanacetum coccineum TaxID=301880 RepID=A0ABQ4WIJ9_9ASTR